MPPHPLKKTAPAIITGYFFIKKNITQIAILIAFLAVLAPTDRVVAADNSTDAYMNGQEFCQTVINDFQKEMEVGKFVQVPFDYANPAKGQTTIYGMISKKYDPTKPTVVIFTGGPGQSGHIQIEPAYVAIMRMGFNIITFDQRGVACSRPATEADCLRQWATYLTAD